MTLNKVIETGSYSGNGSSQTITIGWQPGLVVIASQRTGGPASGRALSHATEDIGSASMMENSFEAVHTTTNGITLTSTGFSVGSDDIINRSGETFHWYAIREGPWMDTGTYTGNASATQAIALGRQPDSVIIWQETATERTVWKWASISGSSAFEFQTVMTLASSLCTITSTGFTAEGVCNTNTETYSYVVLYSIVGDTRHFESGTYSGDGADSRTFTLGYQPRTVCLLGNATEVSVHKTDTMATGTHGSIQTGYNWESGGGSPSVTINSTGFSIADGYNESGVSYYWMAGVQ